MPSATRILRYSVLVLAGLGLLLVGQWLLEYLAGPASCADRLAGGEFLTNPTRTSITVTFVPAEETRLYLEYGQHPGQYTSSTSTVNAPAHQTAALRIEKLESDTQYYYRVRCARPERTFSRSRDFGAGEERRFRTLRSENSTVTFAFISASHIYQGWTYPQNVAGPFFELMERTMQNALVSDVDFMVAGGDEVQTHCLNCPEAFVDGISAGRGTVRSQIEAEARYRVMRDFYGKAAHSVPFFLVLGNHDGEAGFGDPRGTCAQFDTTRLYSTAARLRYLPNPSVVYDGGADGNYFSFVSGDALFVILDVMRYTTVFPQSPEDWTLGAEQLRWLERTLSESRQAWKFLFSHHLVGGASHKLCYAYGRGGLKATVDGQLTGAFLGEQARVHELMQKYGAQFFFYGHDHVFAYGEKLDPEGRREGIHYVAGGKPTGGRSSWSRMKWFQDLYDFDGDGTPDYRIDKGFVRVTVRGKESVRLEYVVTDPADLERNGTVLFDKTIPGPQTGGPAAVRPSASSQR